MGGSWCNQEGGGYHAYSCWGAASVAGLGSTGTARTAVGILRLRLGCNSARASACEDKGGNVSSSRRR